MKIRNQHSAQAAGPNFSGKQEIYDDGIVRIGLPAELVPQDGDDFLCFRLDGMPFRITWKTLVISRTELEKLGCPWETERGLIRFILPAFRTIRKTLFSGRSESEQRQRPSKTLEGVMRSFLADLLPEDTLRPVFLANGFYLGSHGCVREGECRSDCLLANFLDEDTIVLASLQVTTPEDWQFNPSRIALLHLLKRSIRSAQCSIGEPRKNTSKAFLNVPKIGIRFPSELGSMIYQFATNYESQVSGVDVSLRYEDEDGRRADLYLYDFGEELIEPGAETDLVREHMDAACKTIEEVFAPKTPEFLGEIVALFGREEMRFLVRWFLLEGSNPEELQSATAILLAARKGVFIKVRFTPLPGETEPQHPILDEFMKDLADVLVA